MSVTILLADAGEMQRHALEEPLRERGVELVSVANGAEALLMLKDLRPQALVANVVLSGVDGYSLCEMVKNDIELVQTRVLLIHEDAVDVDMVRANEVGSDGILQKPFGVEALTPYLDSFGLVPDAGTPADTAMIDESLTPFAAPAVAAAVENAEAADESTFDVGVTDDISFADVTPPVVESEEPAAAFSVDMAVEEPGEPMILGDESEPEAVDLAVAGGDGVSLSVDEPLEVSLMHEGVEAGEFDMSAESALEMAPAAGVGPFDLAESAAAEERSTLLEGPPPAEPADMSALGAGSVAADFASREGQILVEEIVRRLSDDVIREIAWEVVPELAERMIREALQKITR